MAFKPKTARDSLGVAIQPGDRVMVTAWGDNVRLVDTGRRTTVAGTTIYGNVVLGDRGTHDPIGRGKGVSGSYLAVLRRDGEPGFEGNRNRNRNNA